MTLEKVIQKHKKVRKYTPNIINLISNNKIRQLAASVDLFLNMLGDETEFKASQNKCNILIAADTSLFYSVKNELLKNAQTSNNKNNIELSFSHNEATDLYDEMSICEDDGGVPSGGGTLKVLSTIPFYLGSTQNMTYHNIPITVTYDYVVPVEKGIPNSELDSPNVKKLIITCNSIEERQTVEGHLKDAIYKEYYTGYRTIHVSQMGQNATGDKNTRPVSSVILPVEQKKRILETIDVFKESKEKYAAMGLPYHTGILLEGPPGTGKTSLAKMIATYMERDLYVVSVNSFRDDAYFIDIISGLSSNSVIVFEDIDTNRMTMRDDKKEKGVTLTGLLNALDGIMTPEGSVFILTTNKIDNIDKAMYRPGRVDLVEHVGYVNTEQFRLFCEEFKQGTSVPDSFDESLKITTSELMQCFRNNMHTPDKTQDSLEQLMQNKRENNQCTNTEQYTSIEIAPIIQDSTLETPTIGMAKNSLILKLKKKLVHLKILVR